MAGCFGKATKFLKQGYNKAVDDKKAQAQMLMDNESIIIDQKVDWCDATCLWTTKNHYKLYAGNKDGIVNFNDHSLAVWDEDSDCICRCFSRHARPFNGKLKIDGFEIAKTHNEYRCHSWNPCCSCPCSFPEMHVLQGDNIIGSIRIPYYVPGCGDKGNACSIMEMEILDANKNLIYKISGDCCQKSCWFCPFRCWGCERTSYTIREPQPQSSLPNQQEINPEDSVTTLQIGKIVNIYKECPEEFFTTADKFQLFFPRNASANQRILLLMATIFLDYSQYE